MPGHADFLVERRGFKPRCSWRWLPGSGATKRLASGTPVRALFALAGQSRLEGARGRQPFRAAFPTQPINAPISRFRLYRISQRGNIFSVNVTRRYLRRYFFLFLRRLHHV
jgi:hypothetical protein